MALQTYLASDYVSRFWRGKAKVPGVDRYNEAITIMDGLVRYLWMLSAAWVIDGFLGFWRVFVG